MMVHVEITKQVRDRLNFYSQEFHLVGSEWVIATAAISKFLDELHVPLHVEYDKKTVSYIAR